MLSILKVPGHAFTLCLLDPQYEHFNLSTKNIPINKLIHSQWRKQCYQHASQEISKLKKNLDKDIYRRYRITYKYFKKRNRQLKFLEKKFNELKIIKRIRITKFKSISMNLDENMFNTKKDSIHFDEFIRISTPYKRTKGRYYLLNIPLKHHKHSNKYKKHNYVRTNTLILRKDQLDRYWINIIWEKEIVYKSQGTGLGIDLGVKKLISTSRNEFIGTKDLHRIYDKIGRKKQPTDRYSGSRNFRQSLIHRNEYINYLINNLSISDLNRIFIENLKDFKKDKKSNSVRYTRWIYKHTINKLSRYCEENGVLLHKINPAYTSQECSNCGAIHEESREKERYECIECYTEENRFIIWLCPLCFIKSTLVSLAYVSERTLFSLPPICWIRFIFFF